MMGIDSRKVAITRNEWNIWLDDEYGDGIRGWAVNVTVYHVTGCVAICSRRR